MLLAHLVIKNKRAKQRQDTTEYYSELAHLILARYPDFAESVDEASLIIDVSDSHMDCFIRDLSVVGFRWRFTEPYRAQYPVTSNYAFFLPLCAMPPRFMHSY